ncbi:MAG: amidohydrolase family protein [Firmicutes bacterium]|nr:amidohydrolase [Alicyclobacillaceae bacterium]MCL6497865.1 amidohydrolase family protein [Bacillota bacterium]
MIRAIDMHVHLPTGDKVRDEKARGWLKPAPEVAEYYARLNMMAVVFDVDNETKSGIRCSNADIAQWVREFPEVFIGFGTVDPWKGAAAVDEVHRCADLGLRGMKFHPATQAFAPNDPQFFPIWEACVERHLAVVIHSGTTAIGAGTPGGRGITLQYCRPIPYIDEIAARYPELAIIMAHPAWPWHDEQLAVARHKTNCYIDLSGWAPRYFPPSVIQYANTLLQDRVFFGSDYPFISPERWLNEFAELPFKEEVRPKILLHNAARFLGLSLEEVAPA